MPSRLIVPLLVAGLAVCASPAFAVPARIHLDAPLLTGPSKTYPSVGVIPKTSKLDVIWCGTGGNWCLVEVKDRIGWVPLSSLTFHTKQDAVAVVQQGNGTGPVGSAAGGPDQADHTADHHRTGDQRSEGSRRRSAADQADRCR